MLFNVILLSFSSSIDSLGIGITYGLRKVKITNLSKLILFIISVSISYLSLFIGSNLNFLFSQLATKFIGSLILIIIGFFISFEVLSSSKKKNNNLKLDNKYAKNKDTSIELNTYKFFIKSLGITFQIIKDPIYSDLDFSSKIDTKEALYLGISLSIDSFSIGLGSSILGINIFIFPILVSLFQLIFLSLGTLIGKKINTFSKIPNNTWNLISAILLISIGITRLFM